MNIDVFHLISMIHYKVSEVTFEFCMHIYRVYVLEKLVCEINVDVDTVNTNISNVKCDNMVWL